MSKLFFDLVRNMDAHNWVRMLVCFTPGLVLGKLVKYADSPALSIASSLLLIVGVTIYLGWKWLRARLLGDADAAMESEVIPESAGSQDGGDGEHQEQTLAALIVLCNGDANVALRLVSTEIAINGVHYGEAILRAYDRKHYESKLDTAVVKA